MATTSNFTCNKDARVADNGSNLGSGTSDGLPYGTYSGYKYRSYLGFSINMAGWTSITSARFYFKTSNQIHIAFGSDPTFDVARCTTAWSEGSSNGLSTSNALNYGNQPSAAGTPSLADAPTTENTWGSVDITQMMRDVLGGAAFTGLRLRGCTNAGAESSSASNVGEIYSRESGSGTAYIQITYETNRAPNAPTISSTDVAAGVTTDDTPTLSLYLSDPDAGDLIDHYICEIATDAAFTSIVQTFDVTGSWPNTGATVTATPTPLTRGVTYYARARAADGTVWGPNSATFQFLVAAAPTVTLTEPSAAGRLGKLLYQTGWLSPRLEVDWTFSCPDGGTQRDYRVEVNSDSAGSPGASFNDSTALTDSAARQRIIPATFVEGSYYHVRVTVTCSHGMTAVVGYYRVRVRWGVITHRHDMGAPTASLALTTLDVTDDSTGGSGHVTVEYATTTGTGAPATWQATIGAAGLNRYVWYRAWLLAWGASPAVSPSLNQIKVTYTTAQIIPDKWVRSDATNQSGDVAAYVYGTKSFRMLGKGSAHWASQQIPVAPNTDYVLSGRIQSLGNSGAYISVASAADSGDLVKTTPIVVSVDFEHPEFDPATGIPGSRVFTIPWNSGSNTSIYIRMVMDGAVGTTSWFDALKMEASTVVTPWSPGYIANAVVLDSGGLQIDAYAGGIFRLRGSNGTPADVIELGTDGLYQSGTRLGTGVFVGNSPPPSPGNGQLWWDDDDATKGGGQGYGMGTSFPASPAVYDRFFRTDYMCEYVWTGSQWLDWQSKMPFPGYFTQAGQVTPPTGSGNSSGYATVTFPIPFSAPPFVATFSSNINYFVGSNGTVPTATNFVVGVYRPVGGGTGATVALQWIAWGPR